MSRNERNRNADTTRRRLLAGLSGAGVAGLAGCSGVFGGGDGTETDDEAQDDETDSEESGDETGEESETRDDGTETPPPEPRFESVSLALPSEATVDATLSATVSVTNTGGVAGTFAGQVRVVEGASDATASFELADVGAGDAAETTVEFTFERADEYVLADGDREVSVCGTLFAGDDPRIVRVDGYRVDAIPHGRMVVARNADEPGVIGLIGSVMGDYGVNIAGMFNARETIGGEALTVYNVDGEVPEGAMEELLGDGRIIEVRQIVLDDD